MENNKIIVFQEKQIRRVWHEEAWWFSIVDVVEVLTETANPRRYWSDLKRKLEAEGFGELYEKIVQLKLESSDGKKYATDCADTPTMFRIIQTIPSPKAEPFKRWLAQVGYERVQEIEDPELAAARARDLYRAKGYPEDWIEMRMKSIETRQQLTSEWKTRGVQEGKEYSILTAEIARATFGVTPSEHKEIKGLERQNLRDHMTNLELIFTMLGEETTRRNAIEDDAQKFEENKIAAKKGGRSAGKALKAYEKDTGKKVLSEQNFKKQLGEADFTSLPELEE